MTLTENRRIELFQGGGVSIRIQADEEKPE